MKHPGPSTPHPMQPIVMSRHEGSDRNGVVRFQANAIVRWLMDEANKGRSADLNRIAAEGFSDEDRRQFAQLIGYSVSAWGGLSYAQGDPSVDKADRIATKVLALDRSRNEDDPKEAVDIDGLANGILHAMVMGALDSGLTEIAEWPMPPPGPLNKVEHISEQGEDPSYVIGTTTFDPTTDHHNLFVTLERRTPRELSPQDRYEVLERLLDLLAVEVAKAKQDAYA